tara:strand:+ start:4442 stop:4930 length:489 start_codon:yes stop_codon:yes gene_type:complete
METLHCYHCTFQIKDIFQMPVSYDIDKNEYEVTGYFCSLECMKAYNAHLNDSYRNNRFSLISQFYDLYDKNIELAPPKECLKIYGGNLTIQEFRKNNSKFSNKNLPPLKVLEFQSELNNPVNNFTWLNNTEMSSTNQVTLERKIPDRNQNTLDKIMNLQTIE